MNITTKSLADLTVGDVNNLRIGKIAFAFYNEDVKDDADKILNTITFADCSIRWNGADETLVNEHLRLPEGKFISLGTNKFFFGENEYNEERLLWGQYEYEDDLIYDITKRYDGVMLFITKDKSVEFDVNALNSFLV